jgi:hypothetical protein
MNGIAFTANPKPLARPRSEFMAAKPIRGAAPAVACGSAVNELGGKRTRRYTNSAVYELGGKRTPW